MRMKWHAKWRNPVRKGVRSGLPARSSTLTQRGEAISMSFGFDRLAPPPRCERLENEPHFLRFRALMRSKPSQTISASFMRPSPRALSGWPGRAVEGDDCAMGRQLWTPFNDALMRSCDYIPRWSGVAARCAFWFICTALTAHDQYQNPSLRQIVKWPRTGGVGVPEEMVNSRPPLIPFPLVCFRTTYSLH